MSKFKQLIRTTLKEWNYPDGFDISKLDGDIAEEGDWLDRGFAIKVFAGQTLDGIDISKDFELPAYVLYIKEDSSLNLTDELISDGPTRISYNNGNRIEHKVNSYSVFDKKEIAEQLLIRFKAEYLNVKAEIIEVYGYGDHAIYFEDPQEAVNYYIDDYKQDQATSGADDYYPED